MYYQLLPSSSTNSRTSINPRRNLFSSRNIFKSPWTLLLLFWVLLFLLIQLCVIHHKKLFMRTQRGSAFSSDHASAGSDSSNVAIHYQSILTRINSRTPSHSNGYCQASTPSRNSYSPLPNYTLDKVLVFARHGDRSPQNIMQDDIDGNITWTCQSNEYTYLHDDDDETLVAADPLPLIAKRVNHINSHAPWYPRMWRGNCAQSELTERGREMLVDFGRSLRDIYIDDLDLLPARLNSSTIRLRSTDISRTLRSTQFLMNGMYPGSDPILSSASDLFISKTRRVSIHTLPTGIDPLHSNQLDQICPRLARLTSQIRDMPLWKEFMRDSLPTRALINAFAPMKKDPYSASSAPYKKGVPQVTENLLARSCHSKPMPCMAKHQVYNRTLEYLAANTDGIVTPSIKESLMALLNQMTKPAGGDGAFACMDSNILELGAMYKSVDFYMRNNYYANYQAPWAFVALEMGPLLREIISVLADNVPMHVFLTHDGTLSGLLGALRAAPEHHALPAYRSSVVVEIWKDSDLRRVVRVLMNGEPIMIELLDNDLEAAGHSLCRNLGDGSCPLTSFVNDLDARSALNWEKMCLVS